MTAFAPGTLVSARGREWLVLPGSPPETVLVRPLGGRDDETALLLPDLDHPQPAEFSAPTVDDRGDVVRARLLRDALRLSFRDTTGPFRSFATLAVSPRGYQLVPLMMATAQDTTRLLIADGVGIGKTVEAGLIAAELLAAGDASRLAVLCSPQLAPQWQAELRTKFGIRAELLLPSTATRLQRQVPFGQTIYDHHPHLIISTDYIKQRSRRDEFAIHCPDLVIVDEAHTCIAPSGSSGASKAHQRYTLLRSLADDRQRHLLLLTATPHNGDDGAWQSLVGLLDDRLGELPADLSGPERDDDRKLLARYLVQRQRADIRDFPADPSGTTEDTPFPTRERAEESYKLTPEYRKLFERVLAFAKEHVTDPELSTVRQRVRWWSAIALLRSLASSPAAAEQTLRNRSGLEPESIADADAVAGPLVFDVEAEDAGEDDDVGLGADTTTDPEKATRRQLRAFADEAAALKGTAGDAKLKHLVSMLKKLLDDGFHPIIFCRYIPTAEYLQEHLTKALGRKARVESVTGSLPPEERETRVVDLTAHDGPRVLVATDCLSEGVNLQEGFTAVLHYDLAWNPTRHEQREGRVDRFGQRAPVVRAVTYYGTDNRIDGVVLDVLLRRHENIRRSTGVSIPVLADSATVMNAIWESLLLRGTEPEQMTLDFSGTVTGDVGDAVLSRWEDAAEREKVSRSRFRQAGLRPDVVAAALADARRSLGGPADAERFTREVLATLSGQIATTDNGFSTTTDTLPRALTDALPPASGRLRFHRQPPAPSGEPLLSRTDPAIEAVARYTLDAALDPLARPEDRPARRAGVMRTAAVDAVTTLLVVRYRVEMVIPGARRTVTHVAEDAQFVAVRAAGDDLTVLDDDVADTLLAATPSGNVHDDLAHRQIEKAIARLPVLRNGLVARGERVVADAVASHRAVRQSSRVAVRGLTARLLPPPDVLGVYVYLPGVAG